MPYKTRKKATPSQASRVNDHETDILLKQLWEIGEESVVKDIYYMIKGRYKILWVDTNEEDRVITYFEKLSKILGMNLFTWDVSRGIIDVETRESALTKGNEANSGPRAFLKHVVDIARGHQNIYERDRSTQKIGKPEIYLMLDFHLHIKDKKNPEPVIIRLLKEFTRTFSLVTLVIVGCEFRCPPPLENELTLVDFPFPSKKEVKHVLDVIVKGSCVNFPDAVSMARDHEEEIIQAATGLTLTEAENAFAKSVVSKGTFDISTILQEKKQIIRKSGILDYLDPRFTIDDIGGLDDLVEWYSLRKCALTQEARDFGIPMPKGTLLLGIPGVGKSMTCEALGSLYSMPLLRLDVGSVFGAYVGESERKMRSCIRQVEAIAPCILWIDEVEKAIGGASGYSRGDNGVSSRVMATLLTWMSEKTSLVYVVCTANNVSSLPPEFVRAGRFDEVFFLDLPDEEQRRDVTSKILRKKLRDPSGFDLVSIARKAKDYTPAEIEKAINNALYVAYEEDKRELKTGDVLSELGKFQPLYNSRTDELDMLREWALGRDGQGGMARKANSIKGSSRPSLVKPIRRLGPDE